MTRYLTTLISACLNTAKKILPKRTYLQRNWELNWQLWRCFWQQWLVECLINGASDWHWEYGATHMASLYTRVYLTPAICSLIKPAVMGILMLFTAKSTKSCYNSLCCIPWASYQIRKIAGCACAGNAGNVFPRRRFQKKPLVSYPGMHHGTCVTHVPWCMSGSGTRGGGENVPGIPGACAPAISRIWQEAHDLSLGCDN